MTTINERLWERRLAGDSVWLVEAYAAWCPACKAFMPTYLQAAELMRDDDVEVGAVNCERNSRICADWLSVRAYPTVLLVNREHGIVQLYDEDAPRTAEAMREWALRVAAEWRYLFSTSTALHLDAAAFGENVLADETCAWLVMFTDGLACSPCLSLIHI